MEVSEGGEGKEDVDRVMKGKEEEDKGKGRKKIKEETK